MEGGEPATSGRREFAKRSAVDEQVHLLREQPAEVHGPECNPLHVGTAAGNFEISVEVFQELFLVLCGTFPECFAAFPEYSPKFS